MTDGSAISSPTYSLGLAQKRRQPVDQAGYAHAETATSSGTKKGSSGDPVVRRGGTLNFFNAINAFFLINEMIVPGSSSLEPGARWRHG